jgi:uncharacterized metal-binding protein YceD (DUF177 family)
MNIQKKTVLCIPVDQCLGGEPILIDEQVDPQFLELEEKDEIVPASPVRISGTIYRAQEWLIVNANISMQFRLPCSTCNEEFAFRIDLPSFFHQEQLDSIKGGFWDMRAILREAILLEVPFIAYCGGSACKNVKEIKPYLREQDANSYQPFRDLL